MAEALVKATGLVSGHFQTARFDNRELHIDVQTTASNEDCFILGSIAPPDEQMFSALLLAHTLKLKKEGARHVTAILPYLAYARHDKDKPGESLATAWLGAIAGPSGIDRIVTVDIHIERGKKLFPISLISLSPAEVFGEILSHFGLTEATIVCTR
jgi:ribose-phosphate pyrophosphokinase